MGSHRPDHDRAGLRTILVCQPVCSAAVEPLRRKRCTTDLVRRDVSASQRWRILRSERLLRIEGIAGTGQDHVASKRCGGRGKALGYLWTADTRIVRPTRHRLSTWRAAAHTWNSNSIIMRTTTANLQRTATRPLPEPDPEPDKLLIPDQSRDAVRA